MVENTISVLEDMKRQQYQRYIQYSKYYTFYKDFWGALDLDNGVYDVVEQRMKALTEHRTEFLDLYESLGDYRSKKVLCNILLNYITFEESLLVEIKEQNFADYYDFDLIPQTEEDEVFVDLGAYTGDSAMEFIQQYNDQYKKMYCYEISKNSFAILQKNLGNDERIVCECKGAGKEHATMYMKEFGVTGTSNSLSENEESGYEVEVVSLDDEIKEKITWIKMDIEGAEQSAILGCKNHIRNDKPKLTICTYHNNEDIWKIPQMIKELNPDYKFFMRYNGTQIGPSEYVLYCL